MNLRHLLALELCLFVAACGPGKSVDSDDNATSADDPSTDGTESESDTSIDPDPTTAEATAESESESDSGDESGPGFVPLDDFSCSVKLSTCDTFAQDCPQGEKCTPVDIEVASCNVGDKCQTILGDKQAGEACTVDFNGYQDDCDGESWCYAQMLSLDSPAICIEFCQGTADNPTCDDPDQVCVYDREYYAGPLGCRSRCDPLGPNVCLDGERCTLGNSGQSDFGCLVASAEIASGEPCSINQACDAGLCLDAVDLLECVEEHCCASFCDVLAPDCPVGTQCVAIEPIDNPESTVGVCALP